MNVAFVAARTARNLSQDELARLLREADEHLSVTKRTIQRWEDGSSSRPRPAHVRALETVMGIRADQLGFPDDVNARVLEDGRGGHDLQVRLPQLDTAPQRPPAGDYSGIWRSRYEFFSSSRAEAFSSQHFVVIQHNGTSAMVRSLPGSANSNLGLDLIVDGNQLRGTWTEDTDVTGHYRGKRYAGAIVLVADGSGSRLAGKWLGAGKENEVNSGTWVFDYQAQISKATVDEYSRPPND